LDAELTAISSVIALLLMAYLYFFVKGTKARRKKNKVLERFSTDGGIDVEVLERGRGSPAATGQKVYIHYELKSADGKTVDSSYRNQTVHETILKRNGEWEEALIGMCIGEERRLRLQSQSLKRLNLENLETHHGKPMFLEIALINFHSPN
jgi:hypothetical protein